jgi:hypothetical protein
MAQEVGFWAGVLTRITSVRQGSGVIGQLSAVMIAALAVMAIAAYCIRPDLYVTIPLLLIVGLVAVLVRDFFIRALQYARDHPEYASIAGQQTVQIIKAQGSKGRPELAPSANVAAPKIDVASVPPTIDDKSGAAPQ